MDINTLVETCEKLKINCTPKRKRLLRLLLSINKPISVCQIVSSYEKEYNQSLTAMSVYRILAIFIEHGLVHHIASSKKYIMCVHSCSQRDNPKILLLICDKCETTQEVKIKETVLNPISKIASNENFISSEQQIELHGLCNRCSLI